MSRAKWKSPYIDKELFYQVIRNKESKEPIKTKSRSSTILPIFVGLTIYIYTGRLYTKLYITENMVGRKLGEFSFTRKIGKIHNKKKKKKK